MWVFIVVNAAAEWLEATRGNGRLLTNAPDLVNMQYGNYNA